MVGFEKKLRKMNGMTALILSVIHQNIRCRLLESA